MSYDWGPHYIVPSGIIKVYSGIVKLREQFDEDLLRKELEALHLAPRIVRVTNPWYYRRKGANTWVKIGESEDKGSNFACTWNTRNLENGQYEVLGLMHVFVKEDSAEKAIAGQNIVEVTIEN
jgi:hypothetical protein